MPNLSLPGSWWLNSYGAPPSAHHFTYDKNLNPFVVYPSRGLKPGYGPGVGPNGPNVEETWVLRMRGLVEIVVGCQMRDLADWQTW